MEAPAVRCRGDDFTDGFMPWYAPWRAGRQVAFGEVKIGAAYPAGTDRKEELTRARNRIGVFTPCEGS
jgi:hypothetical protein